MKLKLVRGGWWGWPEITSITDTKLECKFDLDGVPAGAYQVVIVESNGGEHAFAKPIQVLPAVQEVPKKGS